MVSYLNETRRLDTASRWYRLVHAKGVGVFGEFVVTNKDVAKYTDASFVQLDSHGNSKATWLLARFSTGALLTLNENSQETEWDHHLVRIKLVLATPIDPDKDWFTQDEVTIIAGKDPNYLSCRLYDDIQQSQYPTWRAYAQIIDPAKISVDALAVTKVVPESDCPLLELGKITRNGLPRRSARTVMPG